MVNHQHRRGNSSKGPKQKRDAVGAFFEEYILAIVSLLCDTFDNSKGESTTSEKKRSLGAFRELIKIGKAHISSALPQVSSGANEDNEFLLSQLTGGCRYPRAYDLLLRWKSFVMTLSVHGCHC